MNAAYRFLISLLCMMNLASPQQKKAKSRAALRENDAAIVDLSHTLSYALVVVAIIIGVVVALAVLAALFPVYSGSVSNLSANFTTTNWGNSTANSISPIFSLVISLVGMFAIVGLAFAAYELYKGGHKGKGL